MSAALAGKPVAGFPAPQQPTPDGTFLVDGVGRNPDAYGAFGGPVVDLPSTKTWCWSSCPPGTPRRRPPR
jgi:hypothetical protein